MNFHRAVRAMNETLKQNRLLREQGEDVSLDDRNRSSDLQNNVGFLLSWLEQIQIIFLAFALSNHYLFVFYSCYFL